MLTKYTPGKLLAMGWVWELNSSLSLIMMNRNELCVINLGGGGGGVQLIKAKDPYTVKIVAATEVLFKGRVYSQMTSAGTIQG